MGNELEGKSILPLLKDPSTAWDKAIVSTVGRGNHSVTTSRWRYIRYFDGSEELYDHDNDPHEWFNLAEYPQHRQLKRELAEHMPTDSNIRQFVRAGRYKAVIKTDGEVMLFDILAPMGISEQDDVAKQYPGVVEYILSYLRDNRVMSRYVTIPRMQSKER